MAKIQDFITKTILFFALSMLLALFSFRAAYAFAAGTAISVVVEAPAGTTISDGHVVSYEYGEYKLSSRVYDPNIYGVVSEMPLVSLEDRNLENYQLVDSYGELEVMVSNTNGDIKKGDYVSTSEIPGVGMKATISGHCIGVALEDFNPANPDDVGKVLIFVDSGPKYIETGLGGTVLTAIRSGLMAPFLHPMVSFRYIIAALVAAATFVISFRNFGRISGSSVEALGRNPLAGKGIKRIVFFNFLLTFLVMIGGLAIAYLILIL